MSDAKNLIVEYEREIEELKKNQQKLEKALKKGKTTSENLDNAFRNLQELNQLQKNEIREYQKQLESLKEQVKQNEIDQSSLKIEIEKLSQRNVELSNQISALTEQVKFYEDKESEQIKKEKIREIILKELYTGPVSIETLKAKLEKSKLPQTSQAILEHLNELKTKFNIIGPILQIFPPLYQLNPNPSLMNQTSYLPNYSNDVLDILLVSDLHIEETADDYNVQSQIDAMYNYAAKNNISYIFNLGDIFQAPQYYKLKLTMDQWKRAEQYMEIVSNYLPQDTGIYQLALGGSHDELLIRFGIDPLARLQQMNSEFINLGYRHATIVLGSSMTDNNSLKLHHPDRNLEENVDCSWKVNAYLSSYYNTETIDRDNVYCDIVGGLHRSS